MVRKIMMVLLVTLLALSLSFCDSKQGGNNNSASTSTDGKTYSIGISKIVAHPALDAVEQGIQDELADLDYKSVTYDLQNANGDVNTAKQIANKFKSDKVDVAVGIATPTAQALVGTLSEIPVIYSAVTDPVDANLVASYDQGGANVTGVSDLTPVKVQIEMLQKIMKDKPVTKLGNIYANNESNSVTLAKLAKQACDELGIEFIEATVTNSSEVKQAAETIIDRVDAIYISTDNTVVSALSAVTEVAKGKVPVMSADPSSAEEFDVLAAYGFNYYQMGRVTGKLIARIFKGEKTSAIKTQYMTDPTALDLLVNIDIANELGITIPDEIVSQANKIKKDGVLQDVK